MRLLVIGGTYFLGKTFVEMASEEHSLCLLNRGNRAVTFSHGDRIVQVHGDRHDRECVSKLVDYAPEVVIDFCAYEAGDIRSIVEVLGDSLQQYVFVSTCDVYERIAGARTDETGELEQRDFGGEAGAYILGKVALEQELKECCGQRGIGTTSIRPAFIYGPDNYAPREGIYFKWIQQAGQILYPVDADGSFQMVYVKDVAKVLMRVCGRKEAYGKAYNVCGREPLSYKTFGEVLRQATGIEFQQVEVTVQQVLEQQIPLPFPLTKEESQYYVSTQIQELEVEYTPMEDGMRETFQWFISSR